MNLIKRYGYDRAKRELALMDESSIAMISDSVDYREQVRAGLLEYRRENNIFENGDKYAYLVDWDDSIDSIYSFDPIKWGDNLWNIENMIRHATDKEIAQGYRDE